MKTLLFYIGLVFFNVSFGQEKLDTTQTLDVFLEYRPRFEYREGFKQPIKDSSTSSFFASHRARISLDFELKRFKFHSSIQDVRAWGQYGLQSNANSLSVFEIYVESKISERWSIKLGRQAVELDNGRLFSKANWNQNSKAHDGIDLIYNSKRLKSQLFGFYNQSYTNSSGTYFDLYNQEYKFLFIHSLQINIHKKIELSVLNSLDGYENVFHKNVFYVRGTTGFRLNVKQKNIKGIISGYYQYGQLQNGQQISSFYIQPELKLTTGKITTRLGAELLSGDDQSNPTSFSHSFSTLYGVSFKFNGNINYFTSFPKDVANGGLLNPYLFLLYAPSKKWKIKMEQHLFYLQNNVLSSQGKTIGKYLGYENDVKVKYNVNNFTAIQAGFSLIMTTNHLEEVRGVDLINYPYWGYLMVTFKPQLLHSVKKAIF